MAYYVPTLRDLMQKARFGFKKYMKGTDASIWPNNVYPTAKVMAGQSSEIMGYASYIADSAFAHRARDLESLALHGEEFHIPRKPASPAEGFITVASDGPVSFASASVFRRLDGIEYVAVAGGALTGAGSLQLEAIAAADGQASNSVGGADLEIVSGMTVEDGVTVTAEVGADGISLGFDLEDIESWRARILFRKRNPPHGGSAADYVLWAGEVSGVSFYSDRPTVFVEPLASGAGTVRVFPLMYDLYEDGIPQTADIVRVKNHIMLVKPAGVILTVAAATRKVVNITVSGLYPDTPDVREAVLAELRDTFRRRSRVAGIADDIPDMPYLAKPATFSRSWIWQAVANASGEEQHEITSPAADVTLSPAEKPVLGTVTFV